MYAISIKQLRYYLALSRLKHFGKAAEECAVTQPALSMQIKELEEVLGLSLVLRGKKGVSLTTDGEEVASRAEQILAAVRDIEDYSRTRAGTLSGLFRLGIIPTIAPYILPRLLPEIQETYPHLELKLRETTTPNLEEELLQGELDAIIIALPLINSEFETAALFEDRFLLVTSQNIATKGMDAMDTIQEENLLLLEEGHCLRDHTIAFCEMANPALMSKFGATSLKTLLELVANDLGVTLIPEMAVQSEVAPVKSLHLSRFPDPEPSRTIGLAWRRTSPRSKDFQALNKLIKSKFQSA